MTRPKVYGGIYERFRAAILDGRLRPGDRLPSSRALAGELGVARGTVEAAYALLAGEGLTTGQGRRGTVVLSRGAPARTRPEAPAPARADPPARGGDPLPLQPGLPGLDLFPRKLWSQIVARQARRMAGSDISYPPAGGAWDLRRAICAHLAVSRGIACAPRQVLITGGFQSALGVVARALGARGGDAWVEDPGYALARRALGCEGARLTFVPVDAEGLDPRSAAGRAPSPTLCVVTPSHQFPLGVTMSLGRRRALLAWAAESGAWLVEDDYGGEFHYEGDVAPSLKSLDRDDRVFYVGTFSKTLFPALRIGYVVAPGEKVDACTRTLRLLYGGRAVLEQRVVSELIEDGHFARHLTRMRAAYLTRRRALVAAVRSEFGEALPLHPSTGGLQILARLPDHVDDAALALKAREAGLSPMALSPCGGPDYAGKGLILGFANLPPERASAIVARLAGVLEGAGVLERSRAPS